MSRDRTRYIGGSAVARIMCGEMYGVTAQQMCLWYRGQYEMESLDDNPYVRAGQIFEQIAIDELRRQYWSISESQAHYYGESVGLPGYLGGTIDGICKPPGLDPGVLEVKCPAIRTFRKWQDWGIHQGHVWQCRLYMALTGYDVAYIAVLNRDDLSFEHYTIIRDKSIEKEMLATVDRFWACVQSGDDWTESVSVDVPVVGAGSVEGDAEMSALVAEYTRCKSSQDFYDDRLKEIKLAISKSWPVDCKRVVTASGTVSYVSRKPQSRVDVAKLRTLYPDVYSKCRTVSTPPPYLTVRSSALSEEQIEKKAAEIKAAKGEAK